jgi:flavin-dependent dehydrogenase
MSNNKAGHAPGAQPDVVVVGGGTAGLQAATQLARAGLRVVVLEKRVQGRSGARWCNGVLEWQLERAGLGLGWMPGGPRRGASHMLSPTGAHRFTIDQNPILEADMRALVEHLLALACDAGVEVRWGVSEVRPLERRGRVVAVQAVQGGAPFTLSAALFVDAAGYRGVLRDQVSALADACPPCGPADLCSAQQLMLAIDDVDGARAFLRAHGAAPGDVVTRLASAGGSATVNIGVDPTLEHVSVLAGSIPAAGVPSGPQLVQQVREEHPWMGAIVFGGGGTIPLRRVYDRFTAPGIALVGDAACQVMAGHGSGIGFGLIAGKLLAEAVAGASDPGEAGVLLRYQTNFLRDFGGILAGYDAVRRMSGTLGTPGIEALFELGIFSEPLVRPGLDQRLGLLTPAQALEAGRALARRPDLARVVVPALFALAASRGLYKAYPGQPRGRAFRWWQRAAATLLPTQTGPALTPEPTGLASPTARDRQSPYETA